MMCCYLNTDRSYTSIFVSTLRTIL